MLEFLLFLSLGLFSLLFGLATLGCGIYRFRRTVFVQSASLASNKTPSNRWEVIYGQAIAIDSTDVQLTPLSQTPCLAYEFSILEIHTRPKGGSSSAVLYRECRGRHNLKIKTAHGAVFPNVSQLELSQIHSQDRQDLYQSFTQSRSPLLLAKYKIEAKALGLRRSLRITESIIQEGTDLTVFGQIGGSPAAPTIDQALITDKSRRQFILEASAAVLGGLLITWIAITPFSCL